MTNEQTICPGCGRVNTHHFTCTVVKPTIAITTNISIRKFGDAGYIFWTNNQPVVEVNIRPGATFVNWVGAELCGEGTLIRYIDQYERRAV